MLRISVTVAPKTLRSRHSTARLNTFGRLGLPWCTTTAPQYNSVRSSARTQATTSPTSLTQASIHCAPSTPSSAQLASVPSLSARLTVESSTRWQLDTFTWWEPGGGGGGGRGAEEEE